MTKPPIKISTPQRHFSLAQRDLPVVLTIEGEDGAAKDYLITPAGRNKLGACMQGIKEGTLRVLIQLNR